MAQFGKVHYKLIGEAIREAIIAIGNETAFSEDYRVTKQIGAWDAAGKICRMFQDDNPRFDRVAFYAACNPSEPGLQAPNQPLERPSRVRRQKAPSQ